MMKILELEISVVFAKQPTHLQWRDQAAEVNWLHRKVAVATSTRQQRVEGWDSESMSFWLANIKR